MLFIIWQWVMSFINFIYAIFYGVFVFIKFFCSYIWIYISFLGVKNVIFFLVIVYGLDYLRVRIIRWLNKLICPECSSEKIDCVAREEVDRFFDSDYQFFPKRSKRQYFQVVKLKRTYICSECHHQFDEIGNLVLNMGSSDFLSEEDIQIQENRTKYDLDV